MWNTPFSACFQTVEVLTVCNAPQKPLPSTMPAPASPPQSALQSQRKPLRRASTFSRLRRPREGTSLGRLRRTFGMSPLSHLLTLGMSLHSLLHSQPDGTPCSNSTPSLLHSLLSTTWTARRASEALSLLWRTAEGENRGCHYPGIPITRSPLH